MWSWSLLIWILTKALEWLLTKNNKAAIGVRDREKIEQVMDLCQRFRECGQSRGFPL